MAAGNGTDDTASLCDGKYCNKEHMNFVLNGVLIPTIATCGIVGNILNVITLSWRYVRQNADLLEKGALLGLIALSVSDGLFCGLVSLNFAFHRSKAIFASRNMHFYFQRYKPYLFDVFIKVSTWLTVVVAVSRYIVVCHPIWARVFCGLRTIKIAIVATVLAWFLLMIPMFWMYEVLSYDIGGNATMIVIDLGYLTRNKPLNLFLTYFWALLGYFIPVVILTFSNVNLVTTLARAHRWRRNSAKHTSVQPNHQRITLTLIVLIVMFLILVSPSELLHFYSSVTMTDHKSYSSAVWWTNLLQAVNFAFHFVLYCVVNATFRRTLGAIVTSLCKQRMGSSRSIETLVNRSSNRSKRSLKVETSM